MKVVLSQKDDKYVKSYKAGAVKARLLYFIDRTQKWYELITFKKTSKEL